MVPSFSWGSLLFGAEMGRHPFRERKRGLRALAGGERECPPLPFIKCEMGSPHALLWRMIKGPTPRVSGRGWGPRFPCSSTRLGCRVRPPFPGGAGEEVVSGFGNGRRVSADRKASLGGSGGGEGKNALDTG